MFGFLGFIAGRVANALQAVGSTVASAATGAAGTVAAAGGTVGTVVTSAGWIGYAATAVVATAVTGGGIVGLSQSGVVNVTSGFGQIMQLADTFAPGAINTLQEAYGEARAGAAAALTAAGIQLPQITLTGKIAAVNSKIIAEAAADKAALSRLADAVDKMTGFKASDDAQQTPSATPSVNAALGSSTPAGLATLGALTSPTAGAAETVVATSVSSSTPTRTATATATVSETPTATATQTATVTATGTITATITPTATPTPIFGGGPSVPLNCPDPLIPGGKGCSIVVSVSNNSNSLYAYTVTMAPSTSNLLWTDSNCGAQLGVDRSSSPRSANSPSVPSGANIYQGPVQASNVPSPPLQLQSHKSDSLSVTVWLPLCGATQGGALGPNALTPNPQNAMAGLPFQGTFSWNATELATATPVGQ